MFGHLIMNDNSRAITHISDTHGYHQSVKLIGGDILIHSGDIVDYKRKIRTHEIIEWIDNTPYEYKLIVLGNHDEELSNFELPDKIILLNNKVVNIFGIRFYGVTSTVKERISRMCFGELSELEIKNELRDEKFDILITHGPPKGILDNRYGNSIGSLNLLDYVSKNKPKYHLFGHAHHSKGTYFNGSTIFSNASIVHILADEIVNGVPFNFTL
jgi:Icc-related predicted phosphoesterase